jgi:hypothetical protein
VGERKNVLAVWPLNASADAGGNDEYLLNAGRRCGLDGAMRGLAKRAICMDSAVSMSVSQLCGGAED